ncbi:hypothetical protein A2797_00230 [candidate division WWE3 bacterium RIFCSPHIGHO2_01_FULL_48_15]|uniref:Addiction module toxin, HicA family n=1 Tax=candidate division WWE3 bacterium RIFCSPHIGHO2_01_FULL_48_15 TaxID=1802619 RepID=A0A1F4VB87_UNCKA|nr:MAG: hypothetical protein A2797_00230 [candidate division WWE3 bacterium RIFCSPHIGHO2_01_FULL_48_15]
MSKLYSSNEIIKVLKESGFVFVSQRGSHLKFRRVGNPTLTAIVPANRKEIPRGTLRSILRQAHLSDDGLRT